MARNQTLLKVLTDTRGEARLSLNPAHNISDREAQIGLIQREQERLWADFDWPHLRVERYIPLVDGQRFYDPRVALNEAGAAKTDLSMERITLVEVQDGGDWAPLCNGITSNDRAMHDSQAGAKAWPPQKWAVSEDDTIEVWPVPDQSAVFPDMQSVMRVTGVRDLRPFRDDDDLADLDDRLLVLFCASALLAEKGAKDVSLKLETAQRHYSRLKADLTKSETFSLYGTRRRPVRQRYGHIGRYISPE